MEFRFASWNIRRNSQHLRKMAFLKGLEIDILALQEADPGIYKNILQSGLFNSSAFSLAHRNPAPGELKSRGLGCALFVRKPFTLRSSNLIEQTPLPERTLEAALDSPSGLLTVCSFHAPPGVTWKGKKPETFKTLAHWLHVKEGPIVFGMDANSPKLDHPEHDKCEYWWKDEPVLIGPNPEHGLQDVYRVYLDSNPVLRGEFSAKVPAGPLALSYDRGHGKKHVPCRYDLVYSTPDIGVKNVRYLYEESRSAGSDHAIVIADLCYPA